MDADKDDSGEQSTGVNSLSSILLYHVGDDVRRNAFGTVSVLRIRCWKLCSSNCLVLSFSLYFSLSSCEPGASLRMRKAWLDSRDSAREVVLHCEGMSRGSGCAAVGHWPHRKIHPGRRRLQPNQEGSLPISPYSRGPASARPVIISKPVFHLNTNDNQRVITSL